MPCSLFFLGISLLGQFGRKQGLANRLHDDQQRGETRLSKSNQFSLCVGVFTAHNETSAIEAVLNTWLGKRVLTVRMDAWMGRIFRSRPAGGVWIGCIRVC